MELSREFVISSLRSSGEKSDVSATRQAPSDADVAAFDRMMAHYEADQREPRGGGVTNLTSSNADKATFEQIMARHEVGLQGSRDGGVANLVSQPKGAHNDGENALRELFEKKSAENDMRPDMRSKADTEVRDSTNSARNVDTSLIESLFKGMSVPGNLQTTASAGTEGVAPSSSSPLDAESVETLVSRILVNSPEKGSSEVRLTLHDNILKGAEISITRDLSGNLSISLSTKDSSTFQTLVASRSDLLENLEKSERGTVSVEIRNDSSDEGNMQRRSRGPDNLEDRG